MKTIVTKTVTTQKRFYATMTALMLAMIVTVPSCSPLYETPAENPPVHVPVTGITGVPETATAGTELALIGLVEPADATNTAILWSVTDAGETGAIIGADAATLTITAAGTVVVTATIANGLAASTDYTQDFTITVTDADDAVPIDGEDTEGEGADGGTEGEGADEGIEGEESEGGSEGGVGGGEGVVGE